MYKRKHVLNTNVDAHGLHEIKGDIAGIAFFMVYRIGYDYQP